MPNPFTIRQEPDATLYVAIANYFGRTPIKNLQAPAHLDGNVLFEIGLHKAGQKIANAKLLKNENAFHLIVSPLAGMRLDPTGKEIPDRRDTESAYPLKVDETFLKAARQYASNLNEYTQHRAKYEKKYCRK